MKANCLNCGFSNPPGMRFCGNCGVRLDEPGERTNFGADSSDRPEVFEAAVSNASRLSRFEVEPGGERRNVTVLFADLCDYTGLGAKIDDEELYEILQLFIRMLVEKVSLYEGMVDKIIGDGIMALFGAPVALENAPERAIRAALEMLAGLNQLNKDLKSRVGEELQMHIGIHSGSVIIGSVETGSTVEYTAIGDSVNLARRLQESALPGTVLVSEQIYRTTKSRFEFVPRQAMFLKGIPGSIAGYSLTGFKAKLGRMRGIEGLSSPMVGREEELNILMASVEGLIADRQGRLVFVSGEAGIGKSRLMMEFKERIAPENLAVYEGQSLTYRRSASYWIFHDLLKNYLDVPPNASQSNLKERLVARATAILGDSSSDALPFLENLLLLRQSDKGYAQRMAFLDAEQLRRQTFISIRNLFWGEARRNPIVMVFEDLHWADSASLDLIEFLAGALIEVPVLILCITRTISDSRLESILDIGRKRLGDRCFSLDLSGLNEPQSELLLGQLLGTQEFPASLRDRIVARSAGIPFYIEEMLRMFIDSQIIIQDEGGWKLTRELAGRDLVIPENLQDLILARFDRLDPVQRSVLQTAAVIGRRFNLRLLEMALPPPEAQIIDQAISGLVDKAFILPRNGDERDGDEREYVFRHVLTSDAIYRTLLRRDRARLHTRVGEAIENLYPDELESHVEVLAAHFLRTPHLEKALRYLILAGEKSARDYANTQASLHFKEARHLLSRVDHTPDQALIILIGLGDVLTFIGEYGQARERLFEALQVIDQMQPFVDVQKHCAIHRKIGITYERQGDFDQALVHLMEANKALGKTAFLSPGSKAEILNDLGWIHFLKGNLEEAKKALNIGLRLVDGTQEFSVVASIHNRLGAVAYQDRDYDEAANHVRESLVLRKTIGDLSGVARLYNNLGLLSLMSGNLRAAEENFYQSIDLLEKVGDAEGIALTNINLGLVKFDRGHYESAKAYLEKAQAWSDQIGHRFYLALARSYLGRLMTVLSQYSEAARLLNSSMDIFEELGSQDNLIDCMGYLAELSLAWGDSDGAVRWIDRMGAAIASSVGGAASELSIQKGRLLRYQGVIARLRKDPDRAKNILAESYEIFTSSSEKLESARTLYELGLLARDQGDILRSQSLFDEARLLFTQIGAEKDLEKIGVI